MPGRTFARRVVQSFSFAFFLVSVIVVAALSSLAAVTTLNNS